MDEKYLYKLIKENIDNEKVIIELLENYLDHVKIKISIILNPLELFTFINDLLQHNNIKIIYLLWNIWEKIQNKIKDSYEIYYERLIHNWLFLFIKSSNELKDKIFNNLKIIIIIYDNSDLLFKIIYNYFLLEFENKYLDILVLINWILDIDTNLLNKKLNNNFIKCIQIILIYSFNNKNISIVDKCKFFIINFIENYLNNNIEIWTPYLYQNEINILKNIEKKYKSKINKSKINKIFKKNPDDIEKETFISNNGYYLNFIPNNIFIDCFDYNNEDKRIKGLKDLIEYISNNKELKKLDFENYLPKFLNFQFDKIFENNKKNIIYIEIFIENNQNLDLIKDNKNSDRINILLLIMVKLYLNPGMYKIIDCLIYFLFTDNIKIRNFAFSLFLEFQIILWNNNYNIFYKYINYLEISKNWILNENILKLIIQLFLNKKIIIEFENKKIKIIMELLDCKEKKLKELALRCLGIIAKFSNNEQSLLEYFYYNLDKKVYNYFCDIFYQSNDIEAILPQNNLLIDDNFIHNIVKDLNINNKYLKNIVKEQENIKKQQIIDDNFLIKQKENSNNWFIEIKPQKKFIDNKDKQLHEIKEDEKYRIKLIDNYKSVSKEKKFSINEYINLNFKEMFNNKEDREFIDSLREKQITYEEFKNEILKYRNSKQLKRWKKKLEKKKINEKLSYIKEMKNKLKKPKIQLIKDREINFQKLKKIVDSAKKFDSIYKVIVSKNYNKIDILKNLNDLRSLLKYEVELFYQHYFSIDDLLKFIFKLILNNFNDLVILTGLTLLKELSNKLSKELEFKFEYITEQMLIIYDKCLNDELKGFAIYSIRTYYKYCSGLNSLKYLLNLKNKKFKIKPKLYGICIKFNLLNEDYDLFELEEEIEIKKIIKKSIILFFNHDDIIIKLGKDILLILLENFEKIKKLQNFVYYIKLSSKTKKDYEIIIQYLNLHNVEVMDIIKYNEDLNFENKNFITQKNKKDKKFYQKTEFFNNIYEDLINEDKSIFIENDKKNKPKNKLNNIIEQHKKQKILINEINHILNN